MCLQVKLIVAANEEDDKVDANKDGIADVDQMDPAALAQHKLFLAMSVVKDPKKLQEAWGALFTAYLAVLATLRLEFARTTAFALGNQRHIALLMLGRSTALTTSTIQKRQIPMRQPRL